MNCEVFSGSLKIRWINNQCYQIQLPTGTSILIDPCFMAMREEAKGSRWYGYHCDFDVNELGRVDYVLINHSHWDHVMSLREVHDAYRPIIICSGHIVRALSEYFDLPEVNFFPVDGSGTYRFDDFTLQTLPGRHSDTIFKDVCPSNPHPNYVKELYGMEEMPLLNRLGTLYNINFVITTENNVKIGLSAGDFKYLRRDWEALRPNILIRHRALPSAPDAAEQMADVMDSCRSQIMFPAHHSSDSGDFREYMDRVNAELIRRGSVGRAICPKRFRWYEIGFGLREQE